jgi:hypothetical protein
MDPDLERRLRRHAEAIAGQARPVTTSDLRGPTRSHARWWLWAAAAAVLVAGVGGLVALVGGGGDGTIVTPAGSTPDPSPPTPTTDASPTTDGSPATHASPSTSVDPGAASTTSSDAPPATTVPVPEPIVRPVVDPAICAPIFARGDGELSTSSEPLRTFARGSNQVVPHQVIADPTQGPAGPFVVVLRYFETDGRTVRGPGVDVNGIMANLGVYDNGNGEAQWTVPDGSVAYLRARGVTADELLAVARALVPRPADARVPGFDVEPVAGWPDGFELVVDANNDDERTGRGAYSQCTVAATGLTYQLSVGSGDELLQYLRVIDYVPPLEVGMRDGAVLIVLGPADPAAPTVDDIVDAPPDEWRRLQAQPWPGTGSGDVRWESLTVGSEFLIELVPSPGLVSEPMYVTVSLRRDEGQYSIAFDTSEAVPPNGDLTLVTDVGAKTSRVAPFTGQGLFGTTIDAPDPDDGATIAIEVRLESSRGDVVASTGPIEVFVSAVP